MLLKNITIPGRSGALAALRYIPAKARRDAAAILIHGFTSGKYSMDSLAGYLATRGFEVITFDVVGHKLGASGGEMNHIVQAAENTDDVLAWTRANCECASLVLVGHSMGAAAALQTIAWDRARNADRRPAVPIVGVAALCMGLQPSRGFDGPIGKAMLKQREDYVQGAPALSLLQQLDGMIDSIDGIGPIRALFIAARQDVLISVESVAGLAARAVNSEMIEIDGSHLEAPDRARPAIAAWLNRPQFEATSSR